MTAERPPTFDDVPLRGTKYCGADMVRLARSLCVGDRLLYAREPRNPHDRNAIMMFYHDNKIGYAAREDACRIAPWMDKGWLFACVVSNQYVCGVPHHVHVGIRFEPISNISPAAEKKAVKQKEKEDANAQ